MATPNHKQSSVSGERLDGLTIVVTRPVAQAEATVRCLREAGAKTVSYPVLEITPLPLSAIEKTLARNDWQCANAVIFVSANAAVHSASVIRHYGGLPSGAVRYAIGKMTADALQDVLKPEPAGNIQTPSSGNDSEALLAMSTLQDVAGQHIIIVCGRSEAGGRRLLQQTLNERGAIVTLLICYERKSLAATSAEQRELEAQLQSGDVTVFLALSIETLNSLMENIQNINGWQRCLLLVSHHRVAETARERGWTRCEIVPMNNRALIDTLHALKPTLLNQTQLTSPAI